MVRVFVNDLTGYVGAALVPFLIEDEHEVIGTVDKDKSEFGTLAGVSRHAPSTETDRVKTLVLSADVIILSLFGQLRESLAITKMLKPKFAGEKTLIVVSSLLTWGRTPLGADEDGLKEESFAQRRPFDRYNNFKVVETQALSVQKNSLKTIIVGAGIMYGEGESALQTVFKSCWQCETPSIGIPDFAGKQGSNILPMIHVKDACQIVQRFVESPPEKQYVVAVDKSKLQLREVINGLADSLGLGLTHVLTQEETAVMMKDSIELATVMNADLRFSMEESVVEELGIEWIAEEGFVANLKPVIAQYKATRNLLPLKVAMMGPPGVGKSFYASSLATEYYLPVVNARNAIAYAQELQNEFGEEVRNALKDPTVRLPNELFVRVMRSKMESRECQNKGYVLDGFPRSYEDAAALFLRPEGEEDEAVDEDAAGEEEEGKIQVDNRLVPRSVIILDASDKYLKTRIMSLPGEEIVGTHNDEAGFSRRLKIYRTNTAESRDNTPASYFEAAAGTETLTLSVSEGVFSEVKGEPSFLDKPEVTASLLDTMRTYLESKGKPYNFHPTPEEIAAARAAEEAEERKMSEAEAAERADRELMERRMRQRREEEERKRQVELEAQEKELLEARSLPLRNYLMKHVIPTLTEGLIETCKVMPEDPVDYLAEYLFKHSPEHPAEYY